MACVKPFKGIRYNQTIINNIDQVVSPPYDIISPEERKKYHELHQNNFVRLILGEEYESDNENNNRFTRAGEYLTDWLTKDILIEEEKPSIYLYQQRFTSNGKLNIINGFITAVKICEYSENIILPHENTLSKPKGALTETIQKTNANLDCVYGLYYDENYVLGSVISKYTSSAPTILAHDSDENEHVIWAINDSCDISIITNFMSDKQIAIADGHHRYETALKNRNEIRLNNRANEELKSDYVMMTLVNVFEKDLTVLPTHRIINNISDDIIDNLIQNITNKFDVAKVSNKNLVSNMTEKNAIGLIMPDACYTLTKKADTILDINASIYTKELELTILHKLILEDIMGIDKEKLAAQTNVTYTRSLEEAFNLVNSKSAQMAFICNNIPVKAILDIASQGEKMPQKATYFYPKLLSGLVIRRLI